MRDGSWELVEKGQDVAEARIIQRDAIWKWDLIGSFESNTKSDPRGRIAVLANTSDHAAPVEHGAVYGARGPPLAPLILWLATKFGASGGFGNKPVLRPGGGGGTGNQRSANVPESWLTVNQDDPASDFDSFFYGQQIKLYDVRANEYLDGVVRAKYSDHLVVEIDGRLQRIPFDGGSDLRFGAIQPWDDLAPGDQLALILESLDTTVKTTNVDHWRGLEYTDLPAVDREAINNELTDYVTTGKDQRSMLRSVERLEQIAQVPENRTERGHVGQAGDARIDGKNYLAMQPFVERDGIDAERNRHLDTYNHEFQHLWLNANGFDYNDDKHHSQLADYERGNLLDWDVDENGYTADYQLHRNPELFALYSHEDTNTPVEWEHIVNEVPGYVDTLDPTGTNNSVSSPDPTELLNPSNPQINEGDALEIMWTDQPLPAQYEVVSNSPIQVGPDEYQYQVREVGVPFEEYISVDGDGNLFDGTIDLWYNNSVSSGFEGPLNGQQYLNTDMSESPRRAYAEALNRAFYTHIYARSLERGTGSEDLGWHTALYDGYGTTNVHETAAVMTQVMRTQVSEVNDRKYIANNIEQIATVHPYLMETWLNLFEPSDVAKAELDRLGIPY
ncbi:hypothetical protein C495_03582 [Natronorubrum sulfidifaciens JCM 14089]|uniref:Uncharacterized protein n=2 Tax=Natronorubrum sulfidifaciens TaxID=388259 RepID=L9WG57_9EURY|nr:hypothetical protein C495_03582 [Natronorubrum sulfidifaciens JCM 14089]